MNGCILLAFAITFIVDIGKQSHGAKMKHQANFTKVEIINHWPELAKISYILNTTIQGQSALWVRFKTVEDVNSVNGSFVLKFQHAKRMLNYVTINVDLCEAFQAVHEQNMIQMIFVGLRRVSNIPLHCPFKKDVEYYINGFIIDSKLIPNYLPKVTFIAELKIDSGGRKVISAKLYGQSS